MKRKSSDHRSCLVQCKCLFFRTLKQIRLRMSTQCTIPFCQTEGWKTCRLAVEDTELSNMDTESYWSWHFSLLSTRCMYKWVVLTGCVKLDLYTFLNLKLLILLSKLFFFISFMDIRKSDNSVFGYRWKKKKRLTFVTMHLLVLSNGTKTNIVLFLCF